MVDGFCSSMLQTAASDFAAAYFAALCCREVVAVPHVFYNESWYIHKCAFFSFLLFSGFICSILSGAAGSITDC